MTHHRHLAPSHRAAALLAGVSLAVSLTVAACVRVPPSGPLATAAPTRVEAVPAQPVAPGDPGHAGDPFHAHAGQAYGGHGYGGDGYGGDGYGGDGGDGYGGHGYGGYGYGGYGYGGATYGQPTRPSASVPAMFACRVPADCVVLFRRNDCFPSDPVGVAVAHLAAARRALVKRPEACGIGGDDYQRRMQEDQGRWTVTCYVDRCAVTDHGPRPTLRPRPR